MILNAYIIKKSKDESSKMDSKMAVLEDQMTKVIEYFEENPVNAANDWGEEITTDTKLYTSSSSSDSEGMDEFTKNRTSNQKSRKRKASKHVLFKDNEQSSVEEAEAGAQQTRIAQSTRTKSSNSNVKLEMAMASLEEKTSATLAKMEGVLTKMQRALDNQ